MPRAVSLLTRTNAGVRWWDTSTVPSCLDASRTSSTRVSIHFVSHRSESRLLQQTQRSGPRGRACLCGRSPRRSAMVCPCPSPLDSRRRHQFFLSECHHRKVTCCLVSSHTAAPAEGLPKHGPIRLSRPDQPYVATGSPALSSVARIIERVLENLKEVQSPARSHGRQELHRNIHENSACRAPRSLRRRR